MFRAVVFDDEYIVIQGLQVMIDWQSHGIELVGTASDGYAALALFRELRPDIIFTDIRMPGLDGLQLVELVLQEAPDTYCIVFSGFNEFEYVKRAIQMGVKDYLEKPITIESIEKAIRKVKEQIGVQLETEALKRKWEQSRQDRLGLATMELLLDGEAALSKWEECMGGDAGKISGITVIACTGDIRIRIRADCLAIPVRYGQERLIAVIHFEWPGQDFREMLDHSSDDSAAGIGRTYSSAGQAPLSYKEAQKALRTAHLLKLGGNLSYDEIGEWLSTPRGLSEREEGIILCIRAGNKEELMEQVDRFNEWVRLEKLDPEIAEREILKLIYVALQAFRDNASDARLTEFFQQGYLPHIEIRERSAQGNMLEWFREQMERLADSSMETREKTKHASVYQARAYIEHHLSRDITLAEVAEHVGMNTAYLSVLFKEVMGESYIKFLTRSRMELAKGLLSKGMKVNEVSEKVGYHTYRHFSEVFKKYAGITPGQYKESLGDPS